MQISALESLVTEFFDFCYRFDDLWAGEFFGLVFGVVFVWVAGGVNGFRCSGVCIVVIQLAAV